MRAKKCTFPKFAPNFFLCLKLRENVSIALILNSVSEQNFAIRKTKINRSSYSHSQDIIVAYDFFFGEFPSEILAPYDQTLQRLVLKGKCKNPKGDVTSITLPDKGIITIDRTVSK